MAKVVYFERLFPERNVDDEVTWAFRLLGECLRDESKLSEL